MQRIAQVVGQAGNEGFAGFLVDRVESADRLARRFLDRMADDLRIALAQRKTPCRRNGKQYLAKDLQLVDEVMRTVIGHIGPFPTVRNGQVRPCRGERTRRAHRQGFCDVLVQGREGIDQDGLAQPIRAGYLGDNASTPLRKHDVPHFQERGGEFGHWHVSIACVAVFIVAGTTVCAVEGCRQ